MMKKLMIRKIIFRQLFEGNSSTYTYLLGCPKSRECVLIDPVLETVERDSKILREIGLNLIYGINTHVHADHVTGTGALKNEKYFPKMKSIISLKSGAKSDLLVSHGEIISVGVDINLEVRETPGHTTGCVTYVDHHNRMAFTGDALLIRGCGRTDFQNGDSRRLYRSVHTHIFTLPADYLLYPAHDYNGRTVSSVEEEKRWNPRLTKTEEEFVEIMKNLQLAYPKQIDISVPANLVCGIRDY